MRNLVIFFLIFLLQAEFLYSENSNKKGTSNYDAAALQKFEEMKATLIGKGVLAGAEVTKLSAKKNKSPEDKCNLIKQAMYMAFNEMKNSLFSEAKDHKALSYSFPASDFKTVAASVSVVLKENSNDFTYRINWVKDDYSVQVVPTVSRGAITVRTKTCLFIIGPGVPGYIDAIHSP